MSGPSETTGVDLTKEPHESILKRIDIGLMTGVCALLISFVGIMTSRATFKMNQETEKARVMPIIAIDMGYLEKATARGEVKPHFEVSLNNVGTGIAHIQRVSPLQNGKTITDYTAFENVIMTPRMRGWAKLTEQPGSGYLPAGKSVTPVSYNMGSPGSELTAYLRGEWGTPMENLDIEVCYCSVFDDCWTAKFLDRKRPNPVKSCGVEDVPADQFQTYIDQRTAARQKSN